MTKKLFTLGLLIALVAIAPIRAVAVTGSLYPSVVLKNQFGETSINVVSPGGSGWLDCSFSVASTDSAGKGITGLVGVPCASVFMHTTQTPASGSPNPAAGYILVNLSSKFYKFLGGSAFFESTTEGSPIAVTTGVTAGLAYVITSLGSTSLAQWQNLGLPAGVTPAVGAGFIASSSTVSTGTGQIQIPATSGAAVSLIDAIGSPSLSAQATSGAQLVLRALAAQSSSVTTLQKAAPKDSTVVRLHFMMLPLSTQLH